MLRALRAGVRATAGGLPATFWWLWVGILVNAAGAFVLPYLAIYLTERRGATPAQAGVIASLWGVGSIFAGPAGGLLADRLGRRATMIGALAASGAAMIALGFVERLPLLSAGTLVLGFVTQLYRPAMQAAVGDVVVDDRTRVRAFGLVYWAVNLGFAVAIGIAGALATISYLLLFVLDGVTTLAFAGLVAWKVPETSPPRPPRPGETPASPIGGLVAAFRDPILVTLAALNFVFATMLFQGFTALPLDMRAKGLSAAAYGGVMALNGIAIVALQPFVTRLAATRDSANILALAAVLAGVGWGLNGIARSAPLYAVAILTWTLGEMMNNPTGPALVAALAPGDLRGRYQGAYSLSWALAAAIAPAAGAYVLEHVGSAALWLGCLVAGLALGAAHLAAGGPRRRRLTR